MSFSLDELLSPAYENFPEAENRPVIGITANYSDIDATVRDRYYKQIINAGGVPVIIPPIADTAIVADTLEKVDGILLTGGGDYNPLWCGEEPSPKLHNINRERDAAELILTRLAYNKQIPMLGICRGIQTLAMALGGHVAQDISSQATIKHSQDADREEATHSVVIEEGSMPHGIYIPNANAQHPSPNTLLVNSFHHQAVDNPGSLFRATAHSKDGIIEAIESTEYKNVMGVQWHPEWLGKDGLPLFKWLVDSAKEYKKVGELHSRILTLDTHCDTPMFFHEGVDFTKRDSRILVDLHKMTDGRQDATIMVAYLPQPKEGQEFYENIKPNQAFPKGRTSITPATYADSIFDIIESTVARVPDYLGIARTSADLYANKQMGKKSIMLGIENGLAIEHSLDKLRHFADRGIVYMTLCHNGDNDICDSARGCNTHNGVSEFGEQVIKEMNRLGIMVDMSHAGEKSFYDALEISEKPIVCSHSNSRILCDHPRNLTDDQLRAIAAKGGVVHTTFYHGFLQKTGEADILDGIKHLEHAIDIMGIDHVGIGTDFDGDGGVCGMRDASDIQQFTRQLLRRRYSETDIAKIWGGNWLRVMEEVQKAK
jgi:microsomal dipeptidase-like Zn-dependent dipeptidase/gamma-glutamyl-gamma-aminobutyrate hydrolase PuuD